MRYQEKSMDERLYFRLIKYRMWDKGELSTSHLSNKQIKKKKKNSDLEPQGEVINFIFRVIYAEMITFMRSR